MVLKRLEAGLNYFRAFYLLNSTLSRFSVFIEFWKLLSGSTHFSFPRSFLSKITGSFLSFSLFNFQGPVSVEFFSEEMLCILPQRNSPVKHFFSFFDILFVITDEPAIFNLKTFVHLIEFSPPSLDGLAIIPCLPTNVNCFFHFFFNSFWNSPFPYDSWTIGADLL